MLRPGNVKEKPAPFNSEVKRFSGMLPKDKLIPIRGPGYYDPLLVIQKQKSSAKLLSESRRFENSGSYINHRKAKEIPGPG